MSGVVTSAHADYSLHHFSTPLAAEDWRVSMFIQAQYTS